MNINELQQNSPSSMTDQEIVDLLTLLLRELMKIGGRDDGK